LEQRTTAPGLPQSPVPFVGCLVPPVPADMESPDPVAGLKRWAARATEECTRYGLSVVENTSQTCHCSAGYCHSLLLVSSHPTLPRSADRGKDRHFWDVVCFGVTSSLDDHLRGSGRTGDERYSVLRKRSCSDMSVPVFNPSVLTERPDVVKRFAIPPSSTLADPFHAHSGRHAILPDTGR